MSAIVNRRDVDFMLYEMFGLEALLAEPRFAGWDRATIAAVFDTAQTIAETKFLPCAALVDAHEPHFVDGKVVMEPAVGEALRAFAEAGLLAAGFDEAIGGMQLPMLATMMVNLARQLQLPDHRQCASDRGFRIAGAEDVLPRAAAGRALVRHDVPVRAAGGIVAFGHQDARRTFA